jgi:hypothetical protein
MNTSPNPPVAAPRRIAVYRLGDEPKSLVAKLTLMLEAEAADQIQIESESQEFISTVREILKRKPPYLLQEARLEDRGEWRAQGRSGMIDAPPLDRSNMLLVDETGIEEKNDEFILGSNELKDHVGIINHALVLISGVPNQIPHTSDDELVVQRLVVRCFNSGD